MAKAVSGKSSQLAKAATTPFACSNPGRLVDQRAAHMRLSAQGNRFQKGGMVCMMELERHMPEGPSLVDRPI